MLIHVFRESGAIQHIQRVVIMENAMGNMAAEEKLGREQMKLEYRTLYEEYRRLQGEHVVMQSELKALLDKSWRSQEEGQDALIAARHELENAQAKIEELNQQVVASSQNLKVGYKEKVEKSYRERYSKLEDDLERTCGENNRLRLENSMLRSEYENEKLVFEQQIMEMRSRLAKELENIENERQVMRGALKDNRDVEVQRLEVTRKEAEKYRQQVKLLMAELEGTRLQLVDVMRQSEKMQRDGSKILTDHIVNVNSMQLEMAAMKEQCERYERDLSVAAESGEKTKGELSLLQREKFRLEVQLKDAEHKAKMSVVNLEADIAGLQVETQKRKDELQRELMTALSDLGVVKAALEYQKQLVMDRDKNALVQINAVKEKERVVTEKLQDEKSHLEATVFELERRILNEKTKNEENAIEASRLMQTVEKAKTEAEKEILVLRVKLDGYKVVEKELEHLRTEVPALKQRVAEMQVGIRETLHNEDRLLVRNQQLNSALEVTRGEMQVLVRHEQESLQLLSEKHDKVKSQLGNQISSLEKDLQGTRADLDQTSRRLKHKVKVYRRLISKLRNRLQLTKAEMEELRIEKEALGKSVPHEIHAQVKKQLRIVLARQEEFQQLLKSPHLIATVQRATLFNFPGSELGTRLSQEVIDSTEMQVLKSRLEQLQVDQSEQLKELKDVISAENLKVIKEGFYKPSRDRQVRNQPKHAF